ncbi:MAG TPA: dihydrolipoamide acetyltransferase family protein [Steroidobacteraceae bacterium]|nr:dihydrolipoamide acetyltransferase family protein [Steroidobacteraceae bacterium]
MFKLPDLGEGLSEAEIVRWHVKVGDHVALDAPMLSVETAKAVVEVPSPISGTIVALHAQPGERIETGAPLIEFAPDPGADSGADAGTVVGQMPGALVEDAAGAALEAANAVTRPRVRAVPAARALARSLGVELGSLTGTGRGGLITLDDVMAIGLPARGASSKMHPAPAPAAPRPPAASPAAPAGAAAGGPADVEQLRSLRRAMAQSMALSRDSVMACSVFDDADLHRWRGGADYSTRVLRAIAAGARAEPGLNAWYDADSQSRTLFEHVNVGIAVDTADGLLVPVIRQVDQLDAAQLRVELDRLKLAARERTLKSEELRHFSFMLSNFGMMAGRYATPVVVPPAVAILGTGSVRQDAVALDGKVQVHARMPLSLTFDHRVVTGAEAVRFLGAVIADLERPE